MKFIQVFFCIFYCLTSCIWSQPKSSVGLVCFVDDGTLSVGLQQEEKYQYLAPQWEFNMPSKPKVIAKRIEFKLELDLGEYVVFSNKCY